MRNVKLNAPGQPILLMGNEAIARGAIEAGVNVCASYPGNPSSEIIGTLSQVGPDLGIYVEWSSNEKVALEVATAASFTGLRGITAMKQNGLNVTLDFLMNLNLTGTKGGLVVCVAEDPSAISSTNEQDTRGFAKIGDLPLLEPADHQEAKDMTRWAFELSEELSLPVILRSVTRVSHARGQVTLGELPDGPPKPVFDTGQAFVNFPSMPLRRILKDRHYQALEVCERSEFNRYEGPDKPDLVVVTSGPSYLYIKEALLLLDAADRVGIAKIGTGWPLPYDFVTKALAKADKILLVEEMETFLETNVKALAAQRVAELGPKEFHGRVSGILPDIGELNPDLVARALAQLLDLDYTPREPGYAAQAREAAALAPPRQVGFCAGCPHRATYWAIKEVLALDGRDGFVVGDIGCYSMAFGPSGYYQLKTLHAMGSGPGLASGMGQLGRFGMDQPAMTVIGDSTFFHASLPALINARYNGSNFLSLVLDNSATAMTGFQPHPGTGRTATGTEAPVLDIESISKALGCSVEVADPYDLAGSKEAIYRNLRDDDGMKVLIMRRECALNRSKREGPDYSVEVDERFCLGQACGCNRLCTRVFKCPGLAWDKAAGVSRIEKSICTGCGVCSQICPAGAIVATPSGEES